MRHFWSLDVMVSTAPAERTFTDGLSLFYYGAGVPAGNQAHYPRILAALPATFSGGESFTVDWNVYGPVDYTGSGYAILAPGVGIVESSFTRGDGSLNSYVYQETQDFVLNTISGTVTTDGEAAAGYVIALRTFNITSWDVTDSSGNFSLEAYGPDVPVFIGVDNDGDSSIDYDKPTGDHPKRYTIRNVTGDRTGASINLSEIQP